MALTISHTPGEWDGTFTAAMIRIVDDLLNDGEPIHDATVNIVDGPVATVKGDVVELSDSGVLAMNSGDELVHVFIDTIESLEIP